jgi:hypothetical protein
MTNPRPRLLPALLLVLPLAACGNTTLGRVLTGSPRAPYGGRVRVALDSAPAPEGFVEIALLQARGHGTHADLEHVVSGLQAECARLGGELVVRVRVDQGANGANGVGVCGFESSPR